MPLTNYKYQDGESFSHAIAEGFKNAEKYWGIPGAASGAGQCAMNNKVKTGAIAFVTLSAVALTAAYFLSPAYATFVGTVGTKAATLVSPAITAMSAFAVAYPLVASLVVLAAVAALITAPVLAYKNSVQADQIDVCKVGFFDLFLQDSQGNIVLENGKPVVSQEKDPGTALANPCIKLGITRQKQENNL